MANRTVTATLEFKAGAAKAELTSVESKVRGVDRAVEDLDRDITKIPPDATKAAASIKLLGEGTGAAQSKFDGLGKSSKTTLENLDQRLIRTREQVKRLGDEFNRTGDVGVLERMFKGQGELKALEGLRKKLTGALGQGAADAGPQISKATGDAVGSLPPQAQLALGLAIANAILVASPFIGAAINGALLAGVGLGGIGLGIAGQIHDPAVMAAWTDMTHGLAAEWHQVTRPFIEPLVHAATIFGTALHSAVDGIDFGQLAGLVEPLARGVAGLITAIGPGLSDAFGASGPILKQFAQDLPMVGKAISDMFSSMSRGGKGAAEGLHTLLFILSALISMLGTLLGVLGSIYHGIVSFGDAFGKAAADGLRPFSKVLGDVADGLTKMWHYATSGKDGVETLGMAVGGAGKQAAQTADYFDTLAKTLNLVTENTNTLAGKMTDKLINTMLDADQATLSWHESLTRLTESFHQNGRSIDINKAKGQANLETVQAAIQANLRIYDTNIRSGVSAKDAAAKYDENTAALERQLKKAGLTQKEIDGLVGKYRNVPDIVNTEIATKGLTEAINNLGNLIAKVNGLDGRNFGFTVHEDHVITVREAQEKSRAKTGRERWGGITTHAADGSLRDAGVYSPVNPARYAFAEPATGGEAFVPRRGDYMRSTGILDEASRWYGGRFVPDYAAYRPASGGGGGTTTVVHQHVVRIDGSGLLRNLRGEVQAQGGDVQIVLGTRR